MMERKELLEHLNAVCDTENAAYACSQAIEALEGQIESEDFYKKSGVQYDYPKSEPQQPSNLSPARTKEFPVPGLLKGFCAFLGFILGGLLQKYGALLPIILAVAGWWVGYFIIEAIENKKIDVEYSKTSEANERRQKAYREAKQKYDAEKAKWMEEQKREKLLLRRSVESIIEENKGTLYRIQGNLRKLYGMGIIYPRFQNMVAVNTIREYVEMGLCDQLEGSNGAYSVYLQDLRTERICGSIEDLKRATLAALSQIEFNQGRLIHEIREIDGDMQRLSQSIDQSLAGVNQQMQGIQRDIRLSREVGAQKLDSLSEQMQGINTTIRNAAYNDYIQKRIETTDRYLLTHYRNPLT